jgi:hypothetical protein
MLAMALLMLSPKFVMASACVCDACALALAMISPDLS